MQKVINADDLLLKKKSKIVEWDTEEGAIPF